jgi:hypothetical protein
LRVATAKLGETMLHQGDYLENMCRASELAGRCAWPEAARLQRYNGEEQEKGEVPELDQPVVRRLSHIAA